ncbi:hypothetical protein [Salipaludibacillus daqingensis]|uniref:hypothetical protein n=1 Tax=Salipaludibacillus daqingensis TaxID=3041001 RepID=UPI002475964C|nr:hypothetical protein [Salipaludibacillus daqingensis]
MRKDWLALGSITLSCIAVWGLLFFAFFRSDDQPIDSIANNDSYEMEQEDIGTNSEDSFQENDEDEQSDVSNSSRDLAEVLEEELNDDNFTSSEASLDKENNEKDSQKLTLDNIRNRGIQLGDFDHIATEGVVSIDVVLNEIFDE